MAQSAAEFPGKDEDHPDDLHDAALVGRGCCSCFSFRCFGSRRSDNWERIPPPAGESEAISRSWWSHGVDAIRSARDWSELAAGPRWKTFIRRFNRTGGGRSRTARFQYDPMSYSLNFETEARPAFRDFSSRYSAIPAISPKSTAARDGHVR